MDDAERGGHDVGNGLDIGCGVDNGLDSRRVGIVDDDRATRAQSDNNHMAMAIATRTPTRSDNSNVDGNNITCIQVHTRRKLQQLQQELSSTDHND